MKKRTKYEIWSEILESCTHSSRTKTWIRNNLGLTTRMANEAIEFLEIRELLEETPNYGKTEFKTTKKGVAALKQYYTLISEYFNT